MKRFLPFVALLSLAGCVHRETTSELEPESERNPQVSPPVVVHDLEVVYAGPDGGSSVDLVPAFPDSPGVRATTQPPLFSLGAGHGALGHVDLHSCRERGLPGGYVHVRVTFEPTGRPVRASVESPSEPAPEALVCVGEQLKVAVVPEFAGGDVTLSKSFFVDPSSVDSHSFEF